MVPPQNLFQEVVQDKWDLIVVSPEMMQEAAFTHCILNKCGILHWMGFYR